MLLAARTSGASPEPSSSSTDATATVEGAKERSLNGVFLGQSGLGRLAARLSSVPLLEDGGRGMVCEASCRTRSRTSSSMRAKMVGEALVMMCQVATMRWLWRGRDEDRKGAFKFAMYGQSSASPIGRLPIRSHDASDQSLPSPFFLFGILPID